MNKRITTLMTVGLGLCLTLTAWLAWSNWQLQQRLNTLSDHRSPMAQQSEPDWLQRLAPQTTPAPTSPSTWDPFAELDRMQQQMEQWMQGSIFSGSPSMQSNLFDMKLSQPDIRLEEDSDAYRITIAVPENSEIELNTQVDERTLTINGTITQSMDNLSAGISRNFRSSSRFSRQFTLNDDADSLGVTTESIDQTMVVTIPKRRL